MWGYRMNSAGSDCCQVVDSSEHDNETMDSIDDLEIYDHLSYYQLFNKDSAIWS
jgi:hypothetical protein